LGEAQSIGAPCAGGRGRGPVCDDEPGGARRAFAGAPERAAPDALDVLGFSTADVRPSEQFEAWRTFIADTVELTLTDAPADGFAAEQDVWDLRRFALTSARMPGAGYQRVWTHLRKDPIDHWCLVLYEAQPGLRAPLGFRSLASEFRGSGADARVLTLFVPRDLFAGRTAAFDAASTDIPDTGLGAVLADYLMSLERQLPRLRPAELPAVTDALKSLLAACIVPSADNLAQAQAPILKTTLARARHIIQTQLGSPRLTPAALCRALGVSRSRLYRLFEDLGGVTRYIQRQRLLAALAALSSEADPRTIMQIADAVGFTDASGFSRAFRAEFGFSPSDARGAASAGRQYLPRPVARTQPIHTLGTVLRGLQV